MVEEGEWQEWQLQQLLVEGEEVVEVQLLQGEEEQESLQVQQQQALPWELLQHQASVSATLFQETQWLHPPPAALQ